MNSKKIAFSQKATNDLLEKLKEESKSWESDGKDAWTALRKLGNNKLPDGDEIIIARRLFKELQMLRSHLKKYGGVGIGAFALEAGLGSEGEYSKELYRMTLGPDKDPAKVRLRKSASKYRQLIAAIGKHTKESTSTLANRILVGTSLHPAEAKDWEEVEQVQVALQAIVDSVDREFGLYNTFLETAELKVAHAKAGGELRWPHYDRQHLTLGDDVTAYQQELKSATDIRCAYWEEPSNLKRSEYHWFPLANGSGCLQDNEFFYVPHAYLGFIEMADLPDGDEDPAGLTRVLEELKLDAASNSEKYTEMPSDDFDKESLKPIGQTDISGDWGDYWGQYRSWLVIYPTPDNQRLMPTLYIPYEERGAYLLPLDASSLNILRKAYSITPNEIVSAFDLIKSLIGHIPDTRPIILESFRRTAPWLRYNPFFKILAEKNTEKDLLKNFCKQLWHDTSNTKEK